MLLPGHRRNASAVNALALEEGPVRKLLYMMGASAGGWVGWWIGAKVGMMTGFVLSVIGSAVAFYFVKRYAQSYLG